MAKSPLNPLNPFLTKPNITTAQLTTNPTNTMIQRDALLAHLQHLAKAPRWPGKAQLLTLDPYYDPETDSYQYDTRFTLDDIRNLFLEHAPEQGTWDQFLPPYIPHTPDAHLWGIQTAICALLLQPLYVRETDPVYLTDTPLGHVTKLLHPNISKASLHIDGDFVCFPNHTTVIGGNLRAKDLTLKEGATLIVLGDVILEGKLMDESEWSLLIVCGDLRTRDGVTTSGELIVSGTIYAPFIHASYNHGQLLCLSGVRTRLLVEDDHGASHIWGESSADAVVIDELTGVEYMPLEVVAKRLPDLLYERIRFPEDLDELHDWFVETFPKIAKTERPLFQGKGRGPLFERPQLD